MLLFEFLKDVKDSAYRKATADADFVEQEHPREADGKFTAGSGGAKLSRQEARAGRKEKAQALKKEVEAKGIKIPSGTKIKLRALLKLMEGHIEAKAPVKAVDPGKAKKELVAALSKAKTKEDADAARKEFDEKVAAISKAAKPNAEERGLARMLANEPKKEASKKMSDQELDEAAYRMLSNLKGGAGRGADFDEVTVKNGEANFALRDWGHWKTPADVRGDEREDYDWQELDSKSREKMDQIVKRFSGEYPNAKIQWKTGEKNWVYITLKAK